MQDYEDSSTKIDNSKCIPTICIIHSMEPFVKRLNVNDSNLSRLECWWNLLAVQSWFSHQTGILVVRTVEIVWNCGELLT